MNSIEYKLSILTKIAEKFAKQKISWALGASGMLFIRGVVSDFNDLDLIIAKEDEKKALTILRKLGSEKKLTSKPEYCSEGFYNFMIDKIDIDVIVNFGILAHHQKYIFPLVNSSLDYAYSVNNVAIPLQTLNEWSYYYHLMGRDHKVKLINNYLQLPNTYHALYSSPLGIINLVSNDNSLIQLWLPGQNNGISYTAESNNLPNIINDTKDWLDKYFRKENPDPKAIALYFAGTVFEEKVWKEVMKIPYGKVITYGQIAKTFTGKMSSQAVGQAVGNNPLALIIPCHRVIGANNKIGGYGGGIETKIWLLEHEGINLKTIAG